MLQLWGPRTEVEFKDRAIDWMGENVHFVVFKMVCIVPWVLGDGERSQPNMLKLGVLAPFFMERIPQEKSLTES